MSSVALCFVVFSILWMILIVLFTSVLFFLMIRLPPRSTLCPYTTLFRSNVARALKRLETPVIATGLAGGRAALDRKSTRLNSSHVATSYAVFCLKKKQKEEREAPPGARVGDRDTCSRLGTKE